MKKIKFTAMLLVIVLSFTFINAFASNNKLQFYLAPHIMNDVTGEIIVDIKIKNFKSATADFYDEINGVSFVFTYNKEKFIPEINNKHELKFVVDDETMLKSTDGLSGIVNIDKGEVEFTYLNKNEKQITSDGVVCRFVLKAKNVSELWNSFDRFPLRFVQGTMVAIAHNSESSGVKIIDNVEGIDTSVGGYNIAPSLVSSSINKTIKFTDGSPYMSADEIIVDMDAVPFVSNGIFMVPFRYFADSIGMDVEWQGDAMLAAAYGEYKSLRVSMYNNSIYINSAKCDFNACPVEINDRIFIPVDAVLALYDNVRYDYDGQTATIYIP